MIRRVVYFLFTVFSVISFVPPLAAEPQLLEAQTIKVGVLLALTGQYPMQGNAFREGMQLAQDEINARGGISGKKIEIIIEDTVNDPKNALTAAKKLINHDRVVAALMSSYPEYKTGGSEFERRHIPVIALWDSSPELEEMGDYIFAIGPWTPSSGQSAAEFASAALHAKKAAVITSVDPWAELVSDLFEERFKKLGGTIVRRDALNPETTDFRTVLGRVQAQNPDVIYAPITQNIPVFHTQKSTLGMKAPVISSDVIADEHIAKAPGAFEGVYQTAIKDPQNDRSSELFNRYQLKFKRPVTMPWFVSTGYDGVMLLAAAIEKGGADSERIKRQLYAVRDFQGATQNFTFNDKGSAPQMAGMTQVKSGKFAWIWP